MTPSSPDIRVPRAMLRQQGLQHKVIPPNMHFNTLNPRLKPFYDHLEVPTRALAWPEPRPGQPFRASVNSFGEHPA